MGSKLDAKSSSVAVCCCNSTGFLFEQTAVTAHGFLAVAAVKIRQFLPQNRRVEAAAIALFFYYALLQDDVPVHSPFAGRDAGITAGALRIKPVFRIAISRSPVSSTDTVRADATLRRT